MISLFKHLIALMVSAFEQDSLTCTNSTMQAEGNFCQSSDSVYLCAKQPPLTIKSHLIDKITDHKHVGVPITHLLTTKFFKEVTFQKLQRFMFY